MELKTISYGNPQPDHIYHMNPKQHYYNENTRAIVAEMAHIITLECLGYIPIIRLPYYGHPDEFMYHVDKPKTKRKKRKD